MKQLLLTFLTILLAFSTFAQAPQAFNYQGVARDISGNPLLSQNIGLRIAILKGSATGLEAYQETHTTTTSDLGLFSLQIGTGTIVNGNFGDIDWGSDSHFLQVEIDENGSGSYQLIGTSELLSVPYAKYAENRSKWKNDNTDIFYLDGRVGIGTDAPSRPFHLRGGEGTSIVARIESQNENGATIDFRDPNTTGDWQARIGGSGDGLTFIAGGNARMSILDNGNVGVGTNTPSRAFHLRGGEGTSIVARIESQNENGATIDFRDPNTTGDWLARIGGSGDGLTFIAGGNTRMNIIDNGNVGIGNTEPKSRLQVSNGDIYIDDIDSGVIMMSPNGQCWKMRVNNFGQPMFNLIPCPN